MVFFLSSIKAFHEAKLPGTASKMYNCSEGPLFMLVSLNTALHSISSRSAAFGNIDSGLHIRCNMCWMNIQFRTCSSGANGRNTGEDKHGPLKDGASFDNEKTWRERVSADAKHCDAHAQLGEQDQKEWLCNEKLAIESKRKESPFLTRREKFKNEFLRRIVPWEKLRTELYRERIVKALVWDLQVPLLVLDSSVLAPYDFGDDESESDDSAGFVEQGCTESKVEDDNDAVNEEEWTSSVEAKSNCSDDDAIDLEATAEASLKKLLSCSLEEFEKRVSGECDNSAESMKNESTGTSETFKRPLHKVDRVKYIGSSIHIEADDRPLSSGQLGEVYEVNGDGVVILDIGNDNKEDELEKDEKLMEKPAKASIYWIDGDFLYR